MLPLPAFWHNKNDQIHCESVRLDDLAERFGTPLYVYSAGHIRDAWQRFTGAMAGLDYKVCYSVKANSNLSLLRLLRRLGAGFDIVSGGELARVLAAGASGDDIVFSGVGKTAAEMEQALRAEINCFNVESIAELDRLETVAAGFGVQAPVAIRVNPDVDPKTHPYISTGLRKNKFGIAIEEVRALYARIAASPHLRIQGIDCHIGSQLIDLSPFSDALIRVLTLWDQLAEDGIKVPQIDLGGGVGIIYNAEENPDINGYGSAIRALLGDRQVRVVFEPGRSLVGNAGALLTTVHYVKKGGERTFVIVDAAMTDLIRPALYDAYQRILPVNQPQRCSEAEGTTNVVGPVCESSDFLGVDRDLAMVSQGERLLVLSSGAYGFVMASNYNTRPLPAEVLVDGEEVKLVRPRQEVDSLFASEVLALEKA